MSDHEAVPAAHHDDEISLRELYLIGRRGLPLILVVTVLAALAAWLVLRFAPPRYTAESVVQVSPLQVDRAVSDAVDLSGVTSIGFDTYRTVALGATTLANTRKALPEGNGAVDVPGDLTLEQIGGNATRSLVVIQRVRAGTPKAAEGAANAWTGATVAALRTMLTDSLSSVAGDLQQQSNALGQQLDQAEGEWQAFQAKDARGELVARLQAVADRQTLADQRKDFLDRLQAASLARQKLLSSLVLERSGSASATVQDQLQALEASGDLPQELAGPLRTALGELPDGAVPASQDLATLVARVELQNEAADVAAYAAERSTLASQRTELQNEAQDLRTQIAQLDREGAKLERALTSAQNAYQQVADLAPSLAVTRQLAGNSVRVLSPAVRPDRPVQRSRAVVVLAVAVIAFLAMLVLVYLRAAVAPTPTAREL